MRIDRKGFKPLLQIGLFAAAVSIILTPLFSRANSCQIILKSGLPQVRSDEPGKNSSNNNETTDFEFANPNLYRRLGVAPTATEKEIKKAYQRAAMKFHPDRNRDKSPEELARLEEIFKGVKYAYEVLSDVNKREKYDHGGKAEAGSETIYSYPEGYNAPISRQLWAILRAFFENSNPLFAANRGDALFRLFKYDLNQSLEVRNYILEIAYGRKYSEVQGVILKYLGYAAQYPEFRKAILTFANSWHEGEKTDSANLAMAMNAEYFTEFYTPLKSYFESKISFPEKKNDEKLAAVIDSAFYRLDDKPKMQALALDLFFNSRIGNQELPQSYSMLTAKILEGIKLNKNLLNQFINQLKNSELRENSLLELLAGIEIPEIREVVLAEFKKGKLSRDTKIKILIQLPELMDVAANFDFVLEKVLADWSNNRPPQAIELLAHGNQIEKSVGVLIRIIDNSYAKDHVAHKVKAIETLGSLLPQPKAQETLKEIILSENSYYNAANKQYRVAAILAFSHTQNRTDKLDLFKKVYESTLDKDVKSALKDQLDFLELK